MFWPFGNVQHSPTPTDSHTNRVAGAPVQPATFPRGQSTEQVPRVNASPTPCRNIFLEKRLQGQMFGNTRLWFEISLQTKLRIAAAMFSEASDTVRQRNQITVPDNLLAEFFFCLKTLIEFLHDASSAMPDCQNWSPGPRFTNNTHIQTL